MGIKVFNSIGGAIHAGFMIDSAIAGGRGSSTLASTRRPDGRARSFVQV